MTGSAASRCGWHGHQTPQGVHEGVSLPMLTTGQATAGGQACRQGPVVLDGHHSRHAVGTEGTAIARQ